MHLESRQSNNVRENYDKNTKGCSDLKNLGVVVGPPKLGRMP